ncbi:MAG: hypothetical protein BJ554DRAFT_1833 [Olpidium bornovanus]|uniref:Uncharacterized protein n=1 Tax=Olpidium bornovanus TaxID=278681 RepID=A0A8H7ZRT5_9FUNG|nr:MAG: hypothetical protein BJ554DRAFT_1833 [Olpidium bornovanus]
MRRVGNAHEPTCQRGSSGHLTPHPPVAPPSLPSETYTHVNRAAKFDCLISRAVGDSVYLRGLRDPPVR